MLRDDAFVGIEDEQFVEIHHTSLKHTHNLDVGDGFAVERHRDILHRATHEQPQQFERERHITQAVREEQAHLVGDLVHLIFRL